MRQVIKCQGVYLMKCSYLGLIKRGKKGAHVFRENVDANLSGKQIPGSK